MGEIEETYKVEAFNSFNEIEKSLKKLRKNRRNAKLIFNIYKSAHTLKSSSFQMGFYSIGYLSGLISTVLKEVINKKSRLNYSKIVFLEDFSMSLKKLLEYLLKNNEYELDKKFYDLSNAIIEIKKTAFEANDLLRRLAEARINVRKTNLLVENPINNLGSYDKNTSLSELYSSRGIFTNSYTDEVLNLGVIAFMRGDYSSALSRAEEARDLVILERKGNFYVFIYLYWIYLLFFILLISGGGIVFYKKYQKSSLSQRIINLDHEEDNIRRLNEDLQKRYYSGKISNHDYHNLTLQNEKKISTIRKERINLRNRRIKIFHPRDAQKELENESKEDVNEIIKLQEKYYKDKKISESQYKNEFLILNERISEIEDEKTALELASHKKKNKSIIGSGSEIKSSYKKGKIKSYTSSIINFIKNRFNKTKKDIMIIDNKIIDLLKTEVKGKNLKGKWIKINLKKK